MKLIEFTNKEQQIQDLSYNLDKKSLTIRWRWPKDIDIVYILKMDIFEDFQLDNINEKNVKMYTREEFKEFNGYVETIREINQYRYFIFPAIEQENEITLLKQNDGKNEILVTTGTPKICYEIKEVRSFGSFFSKEKKLQICIYSEVNLSKDVLCYVKKQGSYPLSKEDGICFEFIEDIYAGTNVMPEITVGKNEFLKLFIKNTEKYGNMYNLKKQ
ncbi:hypothetical protein [Clostridium sp. JS66]|uniref:hypothetical protein n=1 Tax=Clostridium sp. JS66 TaxID=3064705 RepID=UPI00298DE22B|nr:hypothetical protein [Clostridium sp. JS66]WPC39291.1 hypothetical protein Q6H37_15350 [Clostridium sp. JS66]